MLDSGENSISNFSASISSLTRVGSSLSEADGKLSPDLNLNAALLFFYFRNFPISRIHLPGRRLLKKSCRVLQSNRNTRNRNTCFTLLHQYHFLHLAEVVYFYRIEISTAWHITGIKYNLMGSRRLYLIK